MAKITARSGWTNIRICNDCKQTIEAGDRCGCPTAGCPLPGRGDYLAGWHVRARG